MYIELMGRTARFLGIILCGAIAYLYASSMVLAGWNAPNEKLKGLLIIFGFTIHIMNICFVGFTLKKLFPVNKTSPVMEIQATRF